MTVRHLAWPRLGAFAAGSLLAAAAVLSPAQAQQKLRETDAWETNRMLTSGVAQRRDHGGGAGAVELRYLPQLDRGHATPRGALALSVSLLKVSHI